jgi:hypothetical protein
VHGRNAILATLVIAFGLGLYSFVAIRRTAGRRSALVDEVAASMPAIPGARIISPWEPATYADCDGAKRQVTLALDGTR